MEKNSILNAFLKAVESSKLNLKKVISEPPKTNGGPDENDLRPLIINLFRMFHLREFSVDFDSHPELSPCGDQPGLGWAPGIDTLMSSGGIELYRQEVLDKDLARSILACQLESGLDVYTTIELLTLGLVETQFPLWAQDELGGFGKLTVGADGSATLNFTGRSEDPDDDTEYIYCYHAKVVFQI